MSSLVPVYRGICPVCGGSLRAHEVELYGSCSNCASRAEKSSFHVYMSFMARSEREFHEFFEKATGFKPWGAQRQWIKRLLRGENTVLIAPTGIGKTTLLLAYALYNAVHNKKVLYIAPTKTLLAQSYKRLVEQAPRVGLDIDRIVYYDSSKSKSTRENLLNKIKTCDYNILVATNYFLVKNINTLLACTPDVVIVDDVDSLLKNEKNVYNLCKLLGFTEKAIELVKKKNTLLWKLLVSKVYGRNYEEAIKEYLEVDAELEAEISSTRKTQLVVASATGKARGLPAKVLKELLKVDLSGVTIYGRNITDSYLLVSSISEATTHLLNLLEKLGSGCIIYISPRHPLRPLYEEMLSRLRELLVDRGYTISTANSKSIADFTEGKIDFLIGYSMYYGSSVRGIDAPLRIKYAVFLGTPVFSIPLENFLAALNMLVRTGMEIASMLGDIELRKTSTDLRRRTLSLSPSERRLVKLALSGKIPEDAVVKISKLSQIYQDVKNLYLRVLELTKQQLDRAGILHMGTITLVKSGSSYLALIPDVMTYIQASGRTSRLVGNRMTHGFSLIVEHNQFSNLVKGLEERLRVFSRELSFKPLESLDLNVELQAISTSRSTTSNESLSYKSILLVVESPTKSRTIAKFFGKPIVRKIGDITIYTIPAKINQEVIEFNIVATRGHIFDLTTNPTIGVHGIIFNGGEIQPVYSTIKRCRVCGTQFLDHDRCPRCGSIAYTDSKQVIEILRKLASEVDEVYIATDPDIEGEKIAYDIFISIAPFNKKIWRIELHEITLTELLKAFHSRRDINMNLVEAELYRRILDRLLGFSLSSKLQVKFNSRNMGAGRVQTPVLGLIIKRYREYLANRCKKIVLKLKIPKGLQISFTIDNANRHIIDELKSTGRIKLVKAFEEIVEVNPKPPFTTDEMLAEASKAGLSPEVAMKLAQELFEAGLITYHRTDSTYISSVGLGIAREYLSRKGYQRLARYSHWGQQGAHEAIRPVYPLDAEEIIQAIDEGLIPLVIPLTSAHLKLYNLIFRRFIASQMKSFKAVKAVYNVVFNNSVLASIEVFTEILEEGFNTVHPVRVFKELRGVNEVEAEIESVRVVNSSRIPLYTSGEVVLEMKRLGIGRPSTYTKILSSIKRHGYVIESRERKKLVPTKKGIVVYEYLRENYPDLVSIEVTRRMEAIIDAISRGEVTGVEAIFDAISRMVSYGLVDTALISLLNLNGNIGSTLALNNFTAN